MKYWGKAAIDLWLLAASSLSCAAPADEVKALLDKNNAAGAYALGKKHPDQLGNAVADPLAPPAHPRCWA